MQEGTKKSGWKTENQSVSLELPMCFGNTLGKKLENRKDFFFTLTPQSSKKKILSIIHSPKGNQSRPKPLKLGEYFKSPQYALQSYHNKILDSPHDLIDKFLGNTSERFFDPIDSLSVRCLQSKKNTPSLNNTKKSQCLYAEIFETPKTAQRKSILWTKSKSQYMLKKQIIEFDGNTKQLKKNFAGKNKFQAKVKDHGEVKKNMQKMNFDYRKNPFVIQSLLKID